MRGRLTLLVSSAAVAGLIGCGGSHHDNDKIASATTLTVYSSLPLIGPERAQAIDIRDAEALALADRDDTADGFRIRSVVLNDATAKRNGWDPATTAANVRRAVTDPTTVAYIGELDSGASAISIPVTNSADILQVSPASTAVGLTQATTGADKGEPAKYYPTTKRTFGRVMPSDTAQGAALADDMRAAGCTTAYVLEDLELYDGGGLGEVVESDAGKLGIRIRGEDLIKPTDDQKAFAKLAAEVKASQAGCVFFGVVAADAAQAVLTTVHDAAPHAKLFAPAQLATPAFAARLSPGVAALTYLTSTAVPRSDQSPAQRRFDARFSAAYHHRPANDAAYGYEAMADVLAAIDAAGPQGDRRHAVIARFLALRRTNTVIGTYEIDRRGDTTATTFSAYRIRDGRLVFTGVYGPDSEQ